METSDNMFLLFLSVMDSRSYFDLPTMKKLSLLSKSHYKRHREIAIYRYKIVCDVDATKQKTLERLKRIMKSYKNDHIEIRIDANGRERKKVRREDPEALSIHLPEHIDSINLKYNRSEILQRGFKCVEIYQNADVLFLEVANTSSINEKASIDATTQCIVFKKAGRLMTYNCDNTDDVMFPVPNFDQTATRLQMPKKIFTIDSNSQFYQHGTYLCCFLLNVTRPLTECQNLTTLKIAAAFIAYDDKINYSIPKSLKVLELRNSNIVRRMVPDNGSFFLDDLTIVDLNYPDVLFIVNLAKSIKFEILRRLPSGMQVVDAAAIIKCPPTLVCLKHAYGRYAKHYFLDFSQTKMEVLNISENLIFKLPSKCQRMSLYRETYNDNHVLTVPDNLVYFELNEGFGTNYNPTLPASIRHITYDQLYTFPQISQQASDTCLIVDEIMAECTIDHFMYISPSLTTFKCKMYASYEYNLCCITLMKHIKHLEITMDDPGEDDDGFYEFICPASLSTLKIIFEPFTKIDLLIFKNSVIKHSDIHIVNIGSNTVIIRDDGLQ